MCVCVCVCVYIYMYIYIYIYIYITSFFQSPLVTRVSKQNSKFLHFSQPAIQIHETLFWDS
jgi:hypothetical protein